MSVPGEATGSDDYIFAGFFLVKMSLHARRPKSGNPDARYLRRETLLQYWLSNALAPLR